MDISAPNNVHSASSALNTAVKGVQENEARFAKAADDVVKSYTAAANVVSSATSSDEVSSETLAAASDPVTPMVDMKQAQQAYEANLKVFSAVDEMSEELLDILA